MQCGYKGGNVLTLQGPANSSGRRAAVILRPFLRLLFGGPRSVIHTHGLAASAVPLLLLRRTNRGGLPTAKHGAKGWRGWIIRAKARRRPINIYSRSLKCNNDLDFMSRLLEKRTLLEKKGSENAMWYPIMDIWISPRENGVFHPWKWWKNKFKGTWGLRKFLSQECI